MSETEAMTPTIIGLGSYEAHAMVQVDAILGPTLSDAFRQWLVGQTMATLDDGRVVCFARDYRRFMARAARD